MLLVAIVVLLVGGGAFWWRWHQRGPSQASISGAVDRFRSSTSAASTPPNAPTPPAAPAALAPKVGVYSYSGTGSERLSFLSTSQSQGPNLPGTVAAAAHGCWTFQIEYNSFHNQSWTWCPSGDKLLERGGVSRQKFDFAAFKMSETSTLTCTPGFAAFDRAARPGQHWTARCAGHSSTTGADVTTIGTVLYIGRQTISVGSTSVETAHYRIDRTMSGGQTGTERDDTWFATTNALPVRAERSIRAVSPAPAPLNKVTYTESSRWQLTSLTPST